MRLASVVLCYLRSQFLGLPMCLHARLCLVSLWTVKASITMCQYVVTDKPSYNPDDSVVAVRSPSRIWQ